ncbi:MAG: ArsR family transcriptional regulator [Thermoplasmata archaeon]|nr:ArsR family transcriptional regulator [Thermoplasmata archaeon]
MLNPAFRSLMWYLLAGTRGGPNRRRLLEELRRSPANAHQLSSTLDLDYRTVRHHLRLLEQNHVVARTVPGAYAPPYELSPYLAEHFDLVWEAIDCSGRPRHRPARAGTPLGRSSQGVQ